MNLRSIKKTTAALVATFATLIVLASGTAYAIGEGQIEGGDIYRIKNVTKNTAFSDPVQASQCETVQYKVRMHNPGPGIVSNINVKVDLPTTVAATNVSKVTITGENAQPATTSDTATLNISSAQKVEYVSGSTQLLDTNNAVLQNLADGITSGGINIGNVGVSINEIKFVQFQAKIGCPEQPQTPVYSCDAFNITANVNRSVKISTFNTSAKNGATFKNAVIEWGDDSAALTDAAVVGKTHQYAKDGTYTITATAHFTVNDQDVTDSGPECQQKVTFSPDKPPVVTPPTVTPPTKLVNTGPGSIAGLFGAVTAMGALAHRKFLSRRLRDEA